LGLLLVAAACDDSSPQRSSANASGITQADQNLRDMLAACGQQASACAGAAGDDLALQMCRDQLAGCRETAGRTGSQAVADAIHVCVDHMQQCEKGANTPSAHAACDLDLQACLGAGRADEADGGNDEDGGSASPVSACESQMRMCVLADGSAETCADELRTCLLAATPGPNDLHAGGEHGRDGGSANSSAPDAGMSGSMHAATPDAGMSGSGGHAAATDAGKPAANTCQDQYDYCVQHNGTPQGCRQQMRSCQNGAGK
jgi:hypothetical protein